MIIKQITKDLAITGEVYSNSRAWGHKVKAIYKGYEVEEVKVRYYNRTWEVYQYQTAWYNLLNKLDDKKSYTIPLHDRYILSQKLRADYSISDLK
jgi:hypothetical protein